MINNEAITSAISSIDPRAAAAVQGVKMASNVTDALTGQRADTRRLLGTGMQILGPLSERIKLK